MRHWKDDLGIMKELVERNRHAGILRKTASLSLSGLFSTWSIDLIDMFH